MTLIYILLILILIAQVYLILKSKTTDNTAQLIKELDKIQVKLENSIKQDFSLNRQELNGSFNNFSIKLDKLITGISTNLNQVRESIEKRLESIQKDNSIQLEKMHYCR